MTVTTTDTAVEAERRAADYLAHRERAVAMTADIDMALRAHFDHPGRQEDLTFAVWRPSTGVRRFTAVLADLVPPHATDGCLTAMCPSPPTTSPAYSPQCPPAAVSRCCTPISALVGKA